MKQIELDYNGISLTVWGYYTKGIRSNDYDTPNENDVFEIEEVWNENQNIYELLKDSIFTDLEEIILERLSE